MTTECVTDPLIQFMEKSLCKIHFNPYMGKWIVETLYGKYIAKDLQACLMNAKNEWERNTDD